jgi:hypothetical protein
MTYRVCAWAGTLARVLAVVAALAGLWRVGVALAQTAGTPTYEALSATDVATLEDNPDTRLADKRPCGALQVTGEGTLIVKRVDLPGTCKTFDPSVIRLYRQGSWILVPSTYDAVTTNFNITISTSGVYGIFIAKPTEQPVQPGITTTGGGPIGAPLAGLAILALVGLLLLARGVVVSSRERPG